MFKRTKQLMNVNTLLKEETENLKREYERKVQETMELSHLLNEMSMGFFLCSVALGEDGAPQEFIVEYANDGIVENGRMKGKKILGQSIKEVFPSFQDSLIKLCTEAVTTGNRPSFIAYDLVEDRYLKFICYAEGECRCACAIMDITDGFLSERMLEDSVERYRSAAMISEGIIFELDMEGRFVYISEGIRKMLGYEPEEYLGRYYYEQYPVEVRKDEAHSFQQCFKECGQEIHGLMTELLAKDGTHHFVMQNGMVLMDRDGTDIGYRGVYIDITKVEKERRKREQSEQEKEAVIDGIGKKLRGPLNGIIGLTSLALNEPRTYKVYHYLQKVEEGAMVLLDIANSMLDYSDLAKEEIQLYEKAFSLELVIKKVTSFLAIKAQEKKVRLVVEMEEHVPDTYSGDSIRLGQILTSLLTGIIKDTSEGDVRLIIRKREKGLLFIMKEMGAIQEGTETAMLVSRPLIDAMGGRSKILNKYKEGTKIYLALPLKQCKEDLVRTTERTYALPNDMTQYLGHALVIEPDATSQMVLCDLLQKFGVRASSAKDAETARRLLAKTHFDLLFLELSMPYASAIIERMRMQKKEKGSVVIALIANSFDAIKTEYDKVGVDDYITKPLDLYKVSYVLQKYLSEEEGTSEIAVTKEQEVSTYPFTHIDYCAAIAQLDNEYTLYNKIVFSFIREYREQVTKFSKIASKDPKDARVYIHTIKGVAQILGAFALSALASQIEEMLLEDKLEDGMVGLFTAELTAVLTELIPYAESIRIQTYTKGFDKEKAAELVQQLDRLLATHSAMAIDQVESIYEVLYLEEEKQAVDKLIDQIEQYDFELARETLQTIRESLGVKE